MTIWFISDTHFGHNKIIQYCDRPFDSLKEMDDYMVSEWNRRVCRVDKVYHLGDFCFGGPSSAERYFKMLNGEIHILDNHFHHDGSWLIPGFDYYSAMYPVYIEHPILIYRLPRKYWIKQKERVLVLSHYPQYVWDRKHYLSWHAFGHCHVPLEIPDGPLSINVSADVLGFAPISLEQLGEIMLAREAELVLEPLGGKE